MASSPASIFQPASPLSGNEPHDFLPDREGRLRAQQIDALLPQYQCGRCGYPDCAAYAQALALRDAEPHRCAPGGRTLARQLAAVSGVALLEETLSEDEKAMCAAIDEEACIGCMHCLRACPIDALIGAAKSLHAVLTPLCSGCGLCAPVCPVDCITLTPRGQPWNADNATAARDRHRARQMRSGVATTAGETAGVIASGASFAEPMTDAPIAGEDARQRAIEKALAVARARRGERSARHAKISHS